MKTKITTELTLEELMLLRRIIRTAQHCPIEDDDEYWDDFNIIMNISFNTDEYYTLKRINL